MISSVAGAAISNAWKRALKSFFEIPQPAVAGARNGDAMWQIVQQGGETHLCDGRNGMGFINPQPVPVTVLELSAITGANCAGAMQVLLRCINVLFHQLVTFVN